MPTIEEVFQETKTIFERQANEAIHQALDKIYTEYLPHVENDTQANVYYQTVDWLTAFFDGTLNDEHVKFDITRRFSSEKARQLIYEANKEEIQKAIGRDLQDEIDSLQAELESAYRNY